MADTLTPNIKLTNQEAGANDNTWGDKADANFERIDDKFGDLTAITTTGGTTTLTDTQELVAIVRVSGALVSNATVVFSGRGGFWMVHNNTSGSFSLTAKVSGQTGVEIVQGDTKLIYCDGTDIEFGNPAAPENNEVTVAAATTTNVLGANSDFVAISAGSGTIASLGTGINKKKFCRAIGTFTLTYHGTTLQCPGQRDITCVAGDTFIVTSDSGSNAFIFAFQRASGKALISDFPIGCMIDYCGATEPADGRWLMASGKTIGNAISGATARASGSADTLAAFTALYDSHSNAVLPIQDSAGSATTRGANAATDFAANKRLPLPDLRGRVSIGRDDMGGMVANRATSAGGIVGTTMGATGGGQTITILQTHLPSVAFTLTVNISDPGHAHTPATGGSFAILGVAGATWTPNTTGPTATAANTSTTTTGIAASGTAASGGSGTALAVLPPGYVCNKIVYVGAA